MKGKGILPVFQIQVDQPRKKSLWSRKLLAISQRADVEEHSPNLIDLQTTKLKGIIRKFVQREKSGTDRLMHMIFTAISKKRELSLQIPNSPKIKIRISKQRKRKHSRKKLTRQHSRKTKFQ